MPRRRTTKRRRRTRKSGATGDRKPQYLTGNVTTSGAGFYASTLMEIPLLNILTGGTKVIELLKLDIQRMSGANQASFAFGARNLNGISTSTYPYTNAALDKAFFANCIINAGNNNYSFDFTDEAGNGQLYPAQQIFATANGSGPENWQVRILYRIKNASLAEYVGIINQYVVTQS